MSRFRALRRAVRFVMLCAALLLGSQPTPSARAAEIPVGSAAEIANAMAAAQPGDVLVMRSGVWTDQRIDFAGHGTEAAPITLRAETPGGVVLNGNSRLRISGSHLVADGLRFEGGALGAGDHVVQFRGPLGEATHSRLTNSAIIDYNPPDIDTRYFWVSLYGQHNRVDHGYFAGQNHSGVTATVWRGDDGPDFHRIDHNHFADRPEGNGNGFETIRVGTSDQSLSDSFTVIENNLFDRVDGEIEIISNKAGGNQIRYNTVLASRGAITLRHGNGSTVEGNFILGRGRDETGGIRVIGERHTIINNYIADVDDRAGGAISLWAGVPNPALNAHAPVIDAVIAHNTVIGVDGAAMTFDEGFGSRDRTLRPRGVAVANNLLVSTGPALFTGTEGEGWVWQGNIAFGGGLGPKAGDPGVTVMDPQLVLGPDGLYRPGPQSPMINAAAGGFGDLLTHDMDGQPRIGVFDVGADEVSDAAIVRRPLAPGDVGPAWLDASPGPTAGCFGQGCAIQAEDAIALLDPDGNGLTWGRLAATEALGGEVLRAPLGSLVDPAQGSQDAVAVFDIVFEQPGVYTAYYRARGFDPSSDSILTPLAAGADPTEALTLSDDGGFVWVVGPSFAVTDSQVGVPLELRVGRRERLAELDAVVLHLAGDLTPTQLDALFEPQVGDLNGDGFVGAGDLDVLLGQWNQAVAPGTGADLTGDGFVGAGDLDVLLGNWNASGPVTGGAAGGMTAPEPATGLWMVLWGLGIRRGF